MPGRGKTRITGIVGSRGKDGPTVVSGVPGRHELVADFMGCSGKVALPARVEDLDHRCLPFGESLAPPVRNHTRQRLHPRSTTHSGRDQAIQDEGALLVSGVVAEPVTGELVRRLIAACLDERYECLAQLRADVAGCVVTTDKIFLFKTLNSRDTLFYRRSGETIEWSTDPAEVAVADLEREAIWRSCRGDDVFVYGDVEIVPPGHVVVLDRASSEVVRFDRVVPAELPPRTGLQEYAEIGYELLLRAVRPYAEAGTTGVLLSGGLDSVAVTTALAEAGGDVVAYHVESGDPSADESSYAQEVCDALSIPLVRVTADTGDGYLDERWRFPHPYNHSWHRWLEQTAERVEQDGITHLLWGREGNVIFGPSHYGVRDVLTGDLGWGEKLSMLRGVLSSRWDLWSILSSARPGNSLLEDSEPVGDNARPTDFLVPMPQAPDDDLNLEFGAQEHTSDLVVWRPRGIQIGNPMGSRELRALSARMPAAYKLIPFGGRLIWKPVLRLMLAGRVPDVVWRRPGPMWLQAPDQRFCQEHTDTLDRLLGSPDSRLVRRNIVDPDRLAAVLTDPVLLRANAATLVCAAMTELFLRGQDRDSVGVG